VLSSPTRTIFTPGQCSEKGREENEMSALRSLSEREIQARLQVGSTRTRGKEASQFEREEEEET